MRKSAVVAIILLLFAVSSTKAFYNRNFGLGLQLGEPTGIAAKFMPTENTGVDMAVGYNYFTNRFTGQIGYLVHFPINTYSGKLHAFAGMGVVAGNDTTTGNTIDSGIYLGGRVPIGIEYIPNRVGFYAQVEPRLDLLPTESISVGGGIGFLFYF